MLIAGLITEKILEVAAELKAQGLWKSQPPAWVMDYEAKMITTEQDFLEWLQFIYLPNYPQQKNTNDKKMIVPQAVKFFSDDMRKGKLLQLLIELDSL